MPVVWHHTSSHGRPWYKKPFVTCSTSLIDVCTPWVLFYFWILFVVDWLFLLAEILLLDEMFGTWLRHVESIRRDHVAMVCLILISISLTNWHFSVPDILLPFCHRCHSILTVFFSWTRVSKFCVMFRSYFSRTESLGSVAQVYAVGMLSMSSNQQSQALNRTRSTDTTHTQPFYCSSAQIPTRKKSPTGLNLSWSTTVLLGERVSFPSCWLFDVCSWYQVLPK